MGPAPATPPLDAQDRRFLGLALDHALKGMGETSPNPMVGAVVVRDGVVLATGFHRRAGEEHAERMALRAAGSGARGGVLYVNLEPCCHQGRTPPCVDEIVAAGIVRVVAASRDPNPLVDGRGLRALERAGVRLAPEDPVFVRRAARLNEVFFKFISTRSPFVALKAGMTIDGRIALPSGESKWITSEAARTEARALRRRYDAVLVGIGTALADDPGLLPDSESGGGACEGSRRPVRILLDSRLRLPTSSRLCSTARDGAILVYASEDAPGERRRELEDRGLEVVVMGRGRIPPTDLLSDLARRGITSVLVEGGGEVLGSFLAAHLVDKLHLFIAARLLGGSESRPAFGGEAPVSLDASLGLTDVSFRAVGDDLLVEAYAAAPRVAVPPV